MSLLAFVQSSLQDATVKSQRNKTAEIPFTLWKATLFQCGLLVYVFYWKLTHCAKTPLACVCPGLWRYVWSVPILDAALFTWEVHGSFEVNLSPRNSTLAQESQQTGNEHEHILHICRKISRLEMSVSLCLPNYFSNCFWRLVHNGFFSGSGKAVSVTQCHHTYLVSKYFYSFSGLEEMLEVICKNTFNNSSAVFKVT